MFLIISSAFGPDLATEEKAGYHFLDSTYSSYLAVLKFPLISFHVVQHFYFTLTIPARAENAVVALELYIGSNLKQDVAHLKVFRPSSGGTSM